jgi:hypothetical protein
LLRTDTEKYIKNFYKLKENINNFDKGNENKNNESNNNDDDEDRLGGFFKIFKP